MKFKFNIYKIECQEDGECVESIISKNDLSAKTYIDIINIVIKEFGYSIPDVNFTIMLHDLKRFQSARFQDGIDSIFIRVLEV